MHTSLILRLSLIISDSNIDRVSLNELTNSRGLMEIEGFDSCDIARTRERIYGANTFSDMLNPFFVSALQCGSGIFQNDIINDYNSANVRFYPIIMTTRQLTHSAAILVAILRASREAKYNR